MSQLLLDVPRVEAFAIIRHGRLMPKDRQRRAEPADVGSLAEKLTRSYLRGNIGEESYARLKVARCAGFLAYALDAYGANFESICDVAEYTVAALVSTITADNRLASGPCFKGLHANLVRSDVFTQIVKLAEIHCWAQKVAHRTPRDVLAGDEAEFRRLVDFHAQMLSALNKVGGNKTLADVQRGAKATLDVCHAAIARSRLKPVAAPSPFEAEVDDLAIVPTFEAATSR